MICPHCSKEFTPGRPHQKFCSPKCRIAGHGDGGLRGALTAVRKCKGDAISFTVRIPASEAARAFAFCPGDIVELVTEKPSGGNDNALAVHSETGSVVAA
jgi:hypothetical protein